MTTDAVMLRTLPIAAAQTATDAALRRERLSGKGRGAGAARTPRYGQPRQPVGHRRRCGKPVRVSNEDHLVMASRTVGAEA